MKLKDIIPRQLLPDSLQEGEDAIDILKADHERVKSLFEQFEDIKDGRANKEKKRIVTEACAELTVHAKVEEEIFYPAVRDAIDEDDLMNEARVEHASAKDLIRQLEAMEPGDEMYAATFTVLSEYINHHVKEEEDEMFPKAQKADLDLEALGRRISARKAQLQARRGSSPATRAGAPRKSAARRRR